MLALSHRPAPEFSRIESSRRLKSSSASSVRAAMTWSCAPFAREPRSSRGSMTSSTRGNRAVMANRASIGPAGMPGWTRLPDTPSGSRRPLRPPGSIGPRRHRSAHGGDRREAGGRLRPSPSLVDWRGPFPHSALRTSSRRRGDIPGQFKRRGLLIDAVSLFGRSAPAAPDRPNRRCGRTACLSQVRSTTKTWLQLAADNGTS